VQLVLLVMILAVLVALATGGRLSRLSGARYKGLGWLATAAVAQLAGAVLGGAAYPICLLASAALMAVFLGGNLHRPGVALLALGFTANALVVLLNGAMPVSLAALHQAGVDRSEAELAVDPRHEPTGDGTLLPWLGDIIPVAIPGAGQVVSAGDIMVAAGAALMLFTAMRERSEPEPAPHHATQ
jgi:uncharacterized protein DUF5317